MSATWKYVAWRLAPVVLVCLAAGFWFNDVQQGGPWVLRNFLPLVVLVIASGIVLHVGDGYWAGAGKKMPLAVVGFAIPALGLSMYLHYAYSVNLNDMFTGVRYPDRVFQYLPVYTLGAGLIGSVIGWIIGRNA